MARFHKQRLLSFGLACLGLAATACTSTSGSTSVSELSIKEVEEVVNHRRSDTTQRICSHISGETFGDPFNSGIWGGPNTSIVLFEEAPEFVQMNSGMTQIPPEKAIVSQEIIEKGELTTEDLYWIDQSELSGIPQFYVTMVFSIENAQIQCDRAPGFDDGERVYEENFTLQGVKVSLLQDSEGNFVGVWKSYPIQ